MKTLYLLLISVLLAGCTFVRYSDSERSLTAVDWHPGGETLSLGGRVGELGELEVNRETGESNSVVGQAIEAAAAAATGIP